MGCRCLDMVSVSRFTLLQEVRITERKLTITHSRGHSPLAISPSIEREKHDRNEKN